MSVSYVIRTIFIFEASLISIAGKPLEFVILIDLYSLSFFMSVLLITLRVLVFRNSYIGPDIFTVRFHALLLSFVFSIVLLIFSPNLVRIIVGWDGLGMRSYLLVVYYSRSKSFKAGIITAITNRIGDCLLIVYVGSYFCINSYSSIILDGVFKRETLLVLVFLVAARTKSAQIPFRAWLPAAIAAPTPVSALVHSSTLVTAGVYLLFRFNKFYLNLVTSNYLLWVGGLTMLLARFRALSEIDIKKIVALSTLRQLGVMVLSLGGSLIKLGFLHLLAHAFFKALLFISTGSIIHACSRYQDMRKAGSVSEAMPVSCRVIFVCLFSLMGIPFIVSFYSKETIIESLVLMKLRAVPWIIIILGVLLTGAYSMRMLYLVNIINSNQLRLHTKSDGDTTVNLRILILLVPASLFGGLLSGLFFTPSRLSLNPLRGKTRLYIILGLGLIFLLFVKSLRYTNFKPRQILLREIWNLPTITPSGPLGLLDFKATKLNFLSDYSWTYVASSRLVATRGARLINAGAIFNRLKFNRILLLILAFICLLLIM